MGTIEARDPAFVRLSASNKTLIRCIFSNVVTTKIAMTLTGEIEMKPNHEVGLRISRREVLIGGTVVAASAGLPPASLALTQQGAKPMNRVKTNDGTEIYYKDWGTGRPVVFSHGWPLTADAWDGQMIFLGQHGYRGPVLATPRPRTRCADERAPKVRRKMKNQDGPCVDREARFHRSESAPVENHYDEQRRQVKHGGQ